MSISQEQMKNIIENLAKLLNNNPKIQGDVQSIVEHMELLNEIDTTGVEPTISVSNFDTRLRPDIQKQFINPQETLKCSNNHIVANHIAITRIM